MLAFVIAGHDLRRRLRDRTAWVLGFVAPFALSAIMGLAFGSADNTALIRVAVADAENTPVSRGYIDQILRSLSLGPGVAIVRTDDLAVAEELYSARRVGAAIGLAPGLTWHIATNRLPQYRTFSSRTRPLGKAVVDAFIAGMTLRQVTGPIVSEALVTAGVAEAPRWHAMNAAVNAPPVVRIAEDEVSQRGSPLGFIGPSMAIVFLFLSVGQAANGVLAERTIGTLTRMQAGPVGLGSIIAGKTLSIVALMFASVVTLWGATTLTFDAYWGPPGAVLVLCAVTVLAIAAIGLFVTVSAGSPATAQVAAAAVAFVLALLGGNFFPPGSLPPFLERLALLTPNGWALDGFTTLSLDHGSVGDILRPLVVLAVIAAVVGTAAVVRFRRAVVA